MARVDNVERRPANTAVLGEVGNDCLGGVHGNRKPDAGGLVGAVICDQRGDADHLAARVQQRAAGVAGIDRGVGLNRVLDGAVAGPANRADRGDDAARHGARQAERIADRIDALADGETRRFGQRRGLQVRRVVDLQQGEVVALVDADDGRLVLVLVGERDLNRWALSMTWLLVRMCPCLSRMKPEPWPCCGTGP